MEKTGKVTPDHSEMALPAKCRPDPKFNLKFGKDQQSCARPFIDGAKKKEKMTIAHFRDLRSTSIREQTQSKI